MTDIAETDHKALLKQLEGSDAIATWSDQRRFAFCKTFADRANVTRYLLLRTAQEVHSVAERRMFISQKHDRDIVKGHVKERDHYYRPTDQLFRAMRQGLNDQNRGEIGGRTIASLDVIAEARAKEIISQLPPLAKAVNIIDSVTAKKIDRKDKLEVECEELRVKLEEICQTIDMADLDQDMTLRQFRKMVSDKEAERDKIQTKFIKLTEEGQKLEVEISKTLYAGLPGLSDAVIEVIRNYIDQFMAMDATSRRVQEKVNFGDSEAALQLLQRFEADENEVSDKVREQFAKALEVLKLSKPALKAAATKKAPKRKKAA